MSDVVAANFVVPELRKKAADLLGSSAAVQFNLHSCYYNDFFLLRTPITINGHPAEIKVVNGEPMLVVPSSSPGISVKLSTISLKAAGPVLTKHGVYHLDTFYHEQESLFSLKFCSKESLKQFLSEKEAVENELRATITNMCVSKAKLSAKQVDLTVGVEVYLVSPTVGSPPQVFPVTLANYPSIAQSWQGSKLFDFTNAMFTDKKPSSEGDDIAELADLLVELNGVIAWFELGVQLKVPTSDLLAIRTDRGTVDSCRLDMLIQWGHQETPTWSKLVSGLVRIRRKGLAEYLEKKYGVETPALSVFDADMDEATTDLIATEQKLSHMEHGVEEASQLRDAVSTAMDTDVQNSIPELEMKLYSLSEDIKMLNSELKYKREENEMLKEAKLTLNKKWSDTIERTRRENNDRIKVVREKLEKKEDELSQTRRKLAEKEKELNEKMKELDIKSDHVIQLQKELEEVREKFSNQQERMNQEIIESNARAQSQEMYLKELQIQHHYATLEANRKKNKMQCYKQELADKEQQICQLSERIAAQEREMDQLRSEHGSTPEQLSGEQHMESDDKRAHELRTLGSSTFHLKLQLTNLEYQRRQKSFELERVQEAVEQQKTDETNQVPLKDSEIRKDILDTTVVALYDYEGRSDQELSFKQGDVLKVTEKTEDPENWWYGLNQDGRGGFIPVEFVQVQDEQDTVSSEPETTRAALVETCTPKHEAQSYYTDVPDTYVVALYDFTGQNNRELRFKSGDVLQVIEKTRESWWYARMGGVTGYIPAAYVEIRKPLQLSALPDPSSIKISWRPGASAPCKMSKTIDVVVDPDGHTVYFRPRDAMTVFSYNSTQDMYNNWSELRRWLPYCPSWGELPDCPTNGPLAMVNGILTCIGGEINRKPTNQLFGLLGEGSSKRWSMEMFPPMPTARKTTRAICNGSHLIVAGGIMNIGAGLCELIEVMDTTTLQWSTVADLPCRSFINSLIECGKYLYAVLDNELYRCLTSDLIQSTAHSSEIWSSPKSYPPRSTFIAIDGRLLSIGGGPTATAIRLYSPDCNTFSVIGHLTVLRHYSLAAALSNNTFIVVGGYTAPTLNWQDETQEVEIGTIL